MVSQHPAKVSNRKVVRVRVAAVPPNIGESHSGDCNGLQSRRQLTIVGSSPTSPAIHNIGERQRGRVGPDCKSGAFRLSGFESHLPDQIWQSNCGGPQTSLENYGSGVSRMGIDTSLCRHTYTCLGVVVARQFVALKGAVQTRRQGPWEVRRVVHTLVCKTGDESPILSLPSIHIYKFEPLGKNFQILYKYFYNIQNK